MGKIESSVTIARPVEDVYAYFLDLDKNATDPDTESVAKEPPGPTQPGTLFRFQRKKSRETTMRIVSLDPDRRIGIEGDVGPARPTGDFLFEPVSGGTKLTVRLDPHPVGPMKLVPPLAGMIGQRIWDGRLLRIKAALERN
jgi:Polyketide cyclase / dehydrase and lipid transport